MTIESLRVSLTSQHRIILLKEKDGVLSLPLFIGQFEAESIVLALQDIEISRPQPHDLMRSIIKALDCQPHARWLPHSLPTYHYQSTHRWACAGTASIHGLATGRLALGSLFPTPPLGQ